MNTFYKIILISFYYLSAFNIFALAPIQQETPKEPGNKENLIYNSLMRMICDRDKDSNNSKKIETFLNIQAPYFFDMVASVDRQFSTTQSLIQEANRLLTIPLDLEEKQFGFSGEQYTYSHFRDRDLTLQELILRPTCGEVDINSVLFSYLAIPKSAVEEYFQNEQTIWLGVDMYRAIYILIKAIYLIDAEKLLLIKEDDAKDVFQAIKKQSQVYGFFSEAYFQNLIDISLYFKIQPQERKNSSLKNLLQIFSYMEEEEQLLSLCDKYQSAIDFIYKFMHKDQKAVKKAIKTQKSA